MTIDSSDPATAAKIKLADECLLELRNAAVRLSSAAVTACNIAVLVDDHAGVKVDIRSLTETTNLEAMMTVEQQEMARRTDAKEPFAGLNRTVAQNSIMAQSSRLGVIRGQLTTYVAAIQRQLKFVAVGVNLFVFALASTRLCAHSSLTQRRLSRSRTNSSNRTIRRTGHSRRPLVDGS